VFLANVHFGTTPVTLVYCVYFERRFSVNEKKGIRGEILILRLSGNDELNKEQTMFIRQSKSL